MIYQSTAGCNKTWKRGKRMKNHNHEKLENLWDHQLTFRTKVSILVLVKKIYLYAKKV
jgi:hypothetical protein